MASEDGFINYGSYGCVFQNIPCGKRDADATLVSKVYSNNTDGRQEWRKTRALASIDPNQYYFVIPKHDCFTDIRTVQKHDPKQECRLLKTEYSAPTNRRLRQIVMDKAEETLYDHLSDRSGNVTRLEVLRLVENCFKGVKLLIEKGLVHSDIYAKNVLIVRGKALLGDFGLMTNAAQFYNTKENIMWNKDISYVPPEMIYALEESCFKNDEAVIDVIRDKWSVLEFMFDDYIARQWFPTDKEKGEKANESLYALLDELRKAKLPGLPSQNGKEIPKKDKRIREMILTNRMNIIMNINRRHNFHKKYDVFSLGIMLLECDQYTIDRKSDDPQVVALYQKLIRGCGSISPDYRFTIDEALAVFAELPALTRTSGGRKSKSNVGLPRH